MATNPLVLSVVALTVLPAGVASPQAAPPGAQLPRGQVVARVPCQQDAGQSYALYLPSSYNADRAWPILYAFDPRARGQVPVELFSKAAERLGFVVVGSNDSRNGPSQPIIRAANAVWVDTHERFAIDPQRVYATGMSGGNFPARLVLAQAGAGMIACAGAFTSEDIASVKAAHAWIAAAGVSDFNFDLNRAAVRELLGRGVVARLLSFEGGHSWPPEDVASRAMDWLELAAMRTGRRAPDPAFVQAQLEGGLARARTLLAAGRVDEAAEEDAGLARELDGLVPAERLQALSAEAGKLRDSPEARKARKREESLQRDARTNGERLRRLRFQVEQGSTQAPAPAAFDPESGTQQADPEAARRELELLLHAYAKDLESSREDKKIVSRRVLDGFYIETFYEAQRFRDEGRHLTAIADLELLVAMRPKVAGPVYELARTYAAQGDRKRALGELRKSVQLGFNDLGRLSADPEWIRMRELPELKEIAAGKTP